MNLFPTHHDHEQHAERGGSLIMVVLLTFVLSVIAASILQLALQGYQDSVRTLQREKSYRIAEGGLLVYQRVLNEFVDQRNYTLTSDDRKSLMDQLANQITFYKTNHPLFALKAGENGSDQVEVSGKIGLFSQSISVRSQMGYGLFGREVVTGAKELPKNWLPGVVMKQVGSNPLEALKPEDQIIGVRPLQFKNELDILRDTIDAVHPFPKSEEMPIRPLQTYADGANPLLVQGVQTVRGISRQGDVIIGVDCTTICMVAGNITATRDIIIQCMYPLGVPCKSQQIFIEGSITAGRDLIFNAPLSQFVVTENVTVGRNLLVKKELNSQIGNTAPDVTTTWKADPLHGNVTVFGDFMTLEDAPINQFVVTGDMLIGKNMAWKAPVKNVQTNGHVVVLGDFTTQEWSDSLIGQDLLIQKKWTNDLIRSITVQGICHASGNVFINTINGFVIKSVLLVDGNFDSNKIEGHGFEVTGDSMRLEDTAKNLNGLAIVGKTLKWVQVGNVHTNGFLISGEMMRMLFFDPNTRLGFGGLASRDGFDFSLAPLYQSLIEIRLMKPDPNQNGQPLFQVKYQNDWMNRISPDVR